VEADRRNKPFLEPREKDATGDYFRKKHRRERGDSICKVTIPNLDARHDIAASQTADASLIARRRGR
jgi:hypothetical protein